MKLENEILRSVFVPDLLTPGQYYDSNRRDSSDVPLKRLMMAMLQDAIRCLQKGSHAKSGAKQRHCVKSKNGFLEKMAKDLSLFNQSARI
jgi:hypothetical protein